MRARAKTANQPSCKHQKHVANSQGGKALNLAYEKPRRTVKAARDNIPDGLTRGETNELIPKDSVVRDNSPLREHGHIR